MNNLSAYPVFLMVELARISGAIDSKLEYDETWNKGCTLYDEFLTSQHNNQNEPMYESMEKFLSEYKPKLLLFRKLKTGGVETIKSETLIEGYEIYPTIEEKIERLKNLYSVGEVAEIIGYYDETLDCEKLEILADTDMNAWIEEIYKLGAENGNFEDAILLNETIEGL